MAQDKEDQQLHSLFNALGVVSQWEKLTGEPSGQPRPAEGSDLAGDDIGTHPYQVSLAAWNGVLAAVSHLGCLRDSLLLQTGPDHFTMRLHTHGQFALVRGALENASQMIWLLEPDERKLRVLRRLQIEWAEAREQDKTRQEIGSPSAKDSAKDRDTRFADLSALARPLAIDPSLIRKKPEYTTIVRAAGQHVATGGTTQVVIWKACSAMTHGDLRGAFAFLTKDTLGEVVPGMPLLRMTANVPLLVTGTLIAIETMKVALNLYRERLRTPDQDRA